MTIPFQRGRYAVRFARTAADRRACQRLRHLAFFGHDGVDADQFDTHCQHLMVEDRAARLVSTLRIWLIPPGTDAAQGYAGQSYDLTALARRAAPMIEVGRFCVAPDVCDTDVVRLVWAALTRLVDQEKVALLFGCTSFPGVDPAPHAHSFARLAEHHLGPDGQRPRPKVAELIDFANLPAGPGRHPMPPILRSYLAMGGWVGDHAVVDRAMNTLHVFTCVDVAAVPPARARALRAIAR